MTGYTKADIEDILEKYHILQNELQDFVNQKRTEESKECVESKMASGIIFIEVNTSCHCHPEYEWEVFNHSVEDFIEWQAQH